MSVLTIRGTECGLIELGQVANITGGEVQHICYVFIASTFYALVSVTVELTVYLTDFMQVNIVDPMTVVDKFSNILATPTIATGVNIKLFLNNDLLNINIIQMHSFINGFMHTIIREIIAGLNNCAFAHF